MEPNLSDDVTCALYAPTGGIVCPFHMTMAFAENACMNGVSFFLNTKVTDIQKSEEGYKIKTLHTDSNTEEIFEAKVVINAAGVYADELNNIVSENKLHITARKGEYCLLDKDAGTHVTHTIFQLPSKMGKGVLVSPTVHGNLLVGPTALDVEDKEALNTTGEGLGSLAATSALSVKNVPMRQVITSFAGLRAHEDGNDFVIGEATDAKGFINAAGIESPGLSSAPAIGEMIAGIAKDILGLTEKEEFIATRKGILHPETLSLEERNALIKDCPAYGNIIMAGAQAGYIKETRVAAGRVYSVRDSMYSIYYGNDIASLKTSDTPYKSLEAQRIGNINVIIFNRDSKTVEVGSTNDILGYISSGDEKTYSYIYQNYGTPIAMVIVR